MKNIFKAALCFFSAMQLTLAFADTKSCIQNAIAERKNDEQLMIIGCSIHDADVSIVTDFVKSHPSFTQLFLDDNYIGDDGAKQLAQLNINFLHLDTNKIGPAGAKAIAANTSLTAIWLRSNPIGDSGCAAFANTKTPFFLYITNTNVTQACTKALVQNNALNGLEIDHNNIGDDGIAIMANAKYLAYFSANETEIGDKAAIALAKSTSIQFLEVGHNHITDQGAYALAQPAGFPNKRLYIASNKLSQAGIDALNQSSQYASVCTDDKACPEYDNFKKAK